MTVKSLQEYCGRNQLKVKILYVKQTKYGDYEVIYTFDFNYKGRDYANTNYIVSPELDELIIDEQDFLQQIKGGATNE